MTEDASAGDGVVIANPVAVTLEDDSSEQTEGPPLSSPPHDSDRGAVSEINSSTVHYTADSNSTVTQNQKSAYELSIQRWRDRQKPVKERNLKLYKIIAVIAIIAFFPLGIPAFYHSMKLQEEFYDGIQKGDLSACNKRTLLLNKLLILSFTLCMFTVILILAVYGGVKGGDGTISFAQAHLY